ncbi:MAG: adenylyl-sulfate kinase [Alphaproteobacteria bacterium]
MLNIVIVGHVDHGKSTLVGRLFNDTGSMPEGKVAAIRAVCERRGMPFEWGFLMDALQAERDQGVTIESAHIRFRSARRDYIIIDAPGHREFLRNMVTGAASADAALLVIDAAEGVREQSRRHGYLLHLLGVRQVAVAVNKMDLVDYDAERFAAIEGEIRAYLDRIGVEPTYVIPVSAREGDNVAASGRMKWYDGPTVVTALDAFATPPPSTELPLRLPLQDIYRFDDRRILAGRIESGRLAVGDELLFSPSNETARVAGIESWGHDVVPGEVVAGQSVGITLDEQIFVERGEVASHVDSPPIETNVFRAHLFWLSRTPLTTGQRYKLKLNTTEAQVEVQAIERVIDTRDLAAAPADAVERNGVAEVILRTRGMLALDEFGANPRTGRFVLVDGYDIAGGGIINMEGYPDQRRLVLQKGTNLTEVEHHVSVAARSARNGHRGGVLWFTGLSGSGKSTLAIEVERRLFGKGYQVYVLDGDNVRRGLNTNLGFSPEDRAENIRRVGEVAALFANAGFIVVTAFISPYRSDRERARASAEAFGDDSAFHEIYISADLETCEERDPKGLYKRARAGEIQEFTGISAPYEPPEAAGLVVDTSAAGVASCARKIVDYIERHFTLVADDHRGS